MKQLTCRCRTFGSVNENLGRGSSPACSSKPEKLIDLESSINPSRAYETMLKKIDELVRLLNVKVYKADHELLTISDVTDVRSKLG